MINQERFLEKQEVENYNSRLIQQYIFDVNRDIVVVPEVQQIREYLRDVILR